MKTFLSFALFLTYFAVNYATAQSSPASLERRVDSLFAKLNTTESPGAAVVVVKDGKVVLRKGYGMANLEHKVPITPTTVFDIASVSKQFAGMAIAMLVKQGKISLKDDIRKYIPELPQFGHTITVDHLVHHTSGIRDWPGTLALAGWVTGDVTSFEQILNMAYNQKDLNFEPGSEYAYSNTGYNLLVELVQRVTGEPFRKWTQANIFQPLGMKDTHFQDDHTEVIANKAYGYERRSDGTFRTIHDGLTGLGSSSLYTTVDDLAKWVINFDKPTVGGSAVLEQMQQTSPLNNGKKNNYAFGLLTGEHRGLKTIDHSGGWAGFNTFLVHFPEQHFSVVVLMNHTITSSGQAAYQLVDMYLADKLTPRSKDNEAKKMASKAVDVPQSVLDEYVGTYRLGTAWYVTIARKGNQLTSYATQEEVVPTQTLSQSSIWVPAYGDSIVFKRDAGGKVTGFQYHGMNCPRVADSSRPTDLTEYLGEYYSDELKTFYSVTQKDGKLAMKHRRHGTLNLTHAWKDDFRGQEWFLRGVEFYRDSSGKVAGLLVSQGRNRNQRFTKQDIALTSQK